MDHDMYSQDSSSEEVADSSDPRSRRVKGASRISSACTECRRKKQKCSGEKPVCSECRATGKNCEWPPLVKRGPSKNYISDLETRLTETECLLISVLPFINSAQLHGAVARQRQMLQAASTSRSSSDSKLSQKKFGSTYWTKYPVTDPEGVKQWWHDRKNRAIAVGMPFAGDLSLTPGATRQPEMPSSYQGQQPSYAGDPRYGSYGAASGHGSQQYTLRGPAAFPVQDDVYQTRSGADQYGLGPAGEDPSPFDPPSHFHW